MLKRAAKGAILLAITLSVAATPSSRPWRIFGTSKIFSVAYPAGWVRLGSSRERLQLRSNNDGAEGIVAVPGQAGIDVLEAEGSPQATLEQVIAYYGQGSTVIYKRTIQQLDGNRRCDAIEEVLSKQPILPQGDVPKPVRNVVNDSIFCKIDRHVIVILLRYMEGDKKRSSYRDIALRMAKSLRSFG